jgi:hypothetical protein
VPPVEYEEGTDGHCIKNASGAFDSKIVENDGKRLGDFVAATELKEVP